MYCVSMGTYFAVANDKPDKVRPQRSGWKNQETDRGSGATVMPELIFQVDPNCRIS